MRKFMMIQKVKMCKFLNIAMRLATFVFFVFPIFSNALEIQEGKHYEVISKEKYTGKKPLVTEYFSINCLACAALEPVLSKWLENNKGIEFKRIPVVFDDSWKVGAKAYYVARHFKVEKKFVETIFKKAMESKSHQNFDKNAVIEILMSLGLKKESIENSLQSFSLDIQLKHDSDLMLKNKIFQIPVIVVNNKYKVTVKEAGGLPQMLNIVDELLKKNKKLIATKKLKK